MKNKRSLAGPAGKFILILVLGILLRVILGLTTFHSDLEHFYLAGKVIFEGHFFDFYDATNIVFNYPPLVYFFLGPLSFLLKLPFSKLIYLPFDLGVAWLLHKLFKEPNHKLWAFGLWMFNPINLYATYMVGQFDIIPVFLSVLVVYLVATKQSDSKPGLLLEGVLLGLGASFKIFPFLFLVPLALLKVKWFDRVKVVTVGVLTYLATIIPFLGSAGFKSTALVASQTTKSLYPKIDISGGEAIFLFPLVIIFLYILFLYRKQSGEVLWKRFFLVLLPFFIFTHYHPQWFLWLTPFLILDLVTLKLKHWPLVALSLISFVGLVTLFDPGLSVWLFSPVFPNLAGLPGIWEILGIKVELNFARSLLQTLFVAPAAYWIYYYFPKKEL